MLLSRPPSDAERSHGVRVTWGAGVTPQIWDAVETRFGVEVHECYGMTETSSIVTVNKDGPDHGIGRPLPWFDAALENEGTDGVGELLVRSQVSGLITPGYLNRPDATQRARFNGWWRTGDLVRQDDDGCFHFLGRANDSIRVRGENVSAWQVESVFSAHPKVDQCAAAGVQAEIGEQEIVLFVVPVAETGVEPYEVVNWARDRMPDFQLPRYVRFLAEMPMTPSHRVAKKDLPMDLEAAVDMHDSGRG